MMSDTSVAEESTQLVAKSPGGRLLHGAQPALVSLWIP
jgi:hypothetical protein